MPDWHKDVDPGVGPAGYPDSAYLEWVQDSGLYVDAAGNVDYGPPVPDRDRALVIDDEDMAVATDYEPNGLDTWDF